MASLVRAKAVLKLQPDDGVTDIPRKPNYDFERREREKTKAAESAKKAQAKAEKRGAGQAADADLSGDLSDPGQDHGDA